jgi:predicted transcriptional regulator
MAKRRDRYEIHAAILDVCKLDTNKTGIIHKANLNFKRGEKHIDRLVKKEYLTSRQEDSRAIYSTTPEGMKYLENINKAIKMLKEHPL